MSLYTIYAHLQQFANPTERHILHYYDQPIVQDRESGQVYMYTYIVILTVITSTALFAIRYNAS